MQGRTSGVTPDVREGARSHVGHLRRLLGLGFGLAVIVGSTIGVGILRTPGLVAGHLLSSPAILVAWVVGGLGTRPPSAGTQPLPHRTERRYRRLPRDRERQ